MAYTTINKASDYFNTLLFTGNSGNQSITGNDFTADFTWSKSRSNAESHVLMDTVRDAGTQLNQSLSTNTSNAEGTLNNSSYMTVNSTGFDLYGTSGGTLNYTGYTYATSLWKAGGHTGSSNTDGTITSTVSASTTAGFSIIKYTGNSTSGATIGHGLGAVPKVYFCKKYNSAGDDWAMYHVGTGNTKSMTLNSNTISITNAKYWNNTTPTSSVITLGNGTEVNGNTDTFIGYAFAEKIGYSRFGSFTGNGDTDGSFVYCGFKPAWIMFKPTSSVSNDWYIYDTKRYTINFNNRRLVANGNTAEATTATDKIDIVSNGFKMRHGSASFNTSSETYIFMAFAEAPLVGSNNVPCTAR